jgi:non-ribosomal peptide synthetase component E (peptide arylation enzyme)
MIGVPDDVFGERSTAFVVSRRPHRRPVAGRASGVRGVARGRLRDPDEVRICTELPLTSMYKVDKQALLAELLDAVHDIDVVADVESHGVQSEPHGSRR